MTQEKVEGENMRGVEEDPAKRTSCWACFASIFRRDNRYRKVMGAVEGPPETNKERELRKARKQSARKVVKGLIELAAKHEKDYKLTEAAQKEQLIQGRQGKGDYEAPTPLA